MTAYMVQIFLGDAPAFGVENLSSYAVASMLFLLTFGIGAALAGLAGVMLTPIYSITPGVGGNFILAAFAVVVLGGLGSVPGAVLGGLIIGIAEACVPAELSGYRDVVAYGFLFVVLLVRPQGLLGRVLPTKV